MHFYSVVSAIAANIMHSRSCRVHEVSLVEELAVRALEPHEPEGAGELLERRHYLGGLPPGRQLLQVVEYDGQWVALLWGVAMSGEHALGP